jgi:hypothetical protein
MAMSVIDYALYFRDHWDAKIVPLWGIEMAETGVPICRCRDGVLCDNPGKHAISKWKDAESRLPGIYNNYGIVSDRLVIIDFDSQTSTFPTELPPTYTVATSKGRHQYYSWDGAPLATRLRYAPEIDVKASGGLVVGPGSRTARGGFYEPLNDLPIVPLPVDISETLGPPRSAMASLGKIREESGPYIIRAVELIASDLRLVTSCRNNALYVATINALMVGGGSDTLPILLEAGMATGLSESEASRTIRSAVDSFYVG